MHVRWRELTRGRSQSMRVEVAIDALLLNRELIAGRGLCWHKGRSRWKDQPQGEVVVEGGGRHKRINTMWTSSSSSSFESPKSPGGSSLLWASGASDKISALETLSSRRREHRELLYEIRELCRRCWRIENADKFKAHKLILQHASIYMPNYWIGFNSVSLMGSKFELI